MVKRFRKISTVKEELPSYNKAVDVINRLKTRNIDFHVSIKLIAEAYGNKFIYANEGKNLLARRQKLSSLKKIISDFLAGKETELRSENKNLDDFYERTRILEELEKKIERFT